ncbi:MAG TPA: HIT domain-containing protein [Gammaproteobacteria bacterium]|nr:HIT domain-containing protein [Gammaproteobacteria bacterium]
MTSRFSLHPQLVADCILVGSLPLSQLLLMNDARYPWFILVPRREDVSEIYQLSEADQQQLWRESAELARHLKHGFHADKINIGALGNLVPQLHLHHIARYRTDPAWPGPVWGHSEPQPYEKHGLGERLAMAGEWFGERLEVF